MQRDKSLWVFLLLLSLNTQKHDFKAIKDNNIKQRRTSDKPNAASHSPHRVLNSTNLSTHKQQTNQTLTRKQPLFSYYLTWLLLNQTQILKSPEPSPVRIFRPDPRIGFPTRRGNATAQSQLSVVQRQRYRSV